MYYHGSPHRFDRLLSPEESGNIRPSEVCRRHHRDVIFLTTSLDEALAYAGPGGFLYLVETSSAKPYDQAGKKKPRLRDGVFTVKSDDAKVVLRLRLAKRRRGMEQEFILDNGKEEENESQ